VDQRRTTAGLEKAGGYGVDKCTNKAVGSQGWASEGAAAGRAAAEAAEEGGSGPEPGNQRWRW